MTIGENIRKLRKEANLSQGELAKKLFVTPQAVSRWENGSAEPDIDTMSELAEIFGVSMDYLIHGEEKPVKENNESQKAYHLICLIGSPVMTLFAVCFIIATVITGTIRVLDMIYVFTSLAFLVSVLILEIRNKKERKRNRHNKRKGK